MNVFVNNYELCLVLKTIQFIETGYLNLRKKGPCYFL